MTTLSVSDDLLARFNAWLQDAQTGEPNDPNAMALATATRNGAPSVRMVLMKGHGPDGIRFFTNLESRKGMEIADNPQASLLFHWKSTRRQVRFDGVLQPLTAADNQAYFDSRGRGSRIGAWSSEQSRAIESRAALEDQVAARAKEFGTDEKDGQIPCPPFWGGFRLVPHLIEFWQDQPDRLHDRDVYTVDGGNWVHQILQP